MGKSDRVVRAWLERSIEPRATTFVACSVPALCHDFPAIIERFP
jgi:hypothetical protein